MNEQRERRQHERHAAQARVTLVLFDETTHSPVTLEGLTVDIAQGGMCVHTPKMLHVGTHAVALVARGDASFIKGVEVRSTRYEQGVGHVTGMRFWENPPNAVFDKLLRAARESRDLDAA